MLSTLALILTFFATAQEPAIPPACVCPPQVATVPGVWQPVPAGCEWACFVKNGSNANCAWECFDRDCKFSLRFNPDTIGSHDIYVLMSIWDDFHHEWSPELELNDKQDWIAVSCGQTNQIMVTIMIDGNACGGYTYTCGNCNQ